MPTRSNALRLLLARGVLALLFVFAQQQATLHWLSHAVDAVSQKAKHAPNEVCDDCGGLIAFGAMAPAAAPVLALASGVEPGIDTTPTRSLQRAPQLGFRSRAPPLAA